MKSSSMPVDSRQPRRHGEKEKGQTLERVDIEALVLPSEACILGRSFQQRTLRVTRRDYSEGLFGGY